jgi:hypothetical protein
MGTFSVKMRVWNPAQTSGVEEYDAFVDTGAAFSWISRARLQRPRCAADSKDELSYDRGPVARKRYGNGLRLDR